MTAPMLRYTVLRLALFVAALGVLALVGAGPLTAVVLAALISAVLSYVLLARQRDELARAVGERVERRLPRGPGVDEQAEDAAVARTLTPDEPDPLRLGAIRPEEGGDGQSASPRPSSTP